MEVIEIGKSIPKFVNHEEGAVFDFSDIGAYLLIFYKKPTPEEVNAIRFGEIKIGAFLYQNVIFMAVKTENNDYLDCPYSIHLSKELTNISNLDDRSGYLLHIILIDADAGVPLFLRVVGLRNRFSNEFKKCIEAQKREPFDKATYAENIKTAYRAYTAKYMLQKATITTKIDRKERE